MKNTKSSHEWAERIARLIIDKKGEDILMLDLRRISPVADYFILATAQSPLHSQAITDDLVEKLNEEGYRVHHIEGYRQANWILLDYLNIVVHIFLPEVRIFYGLERLWGDTPKKSIS
ncbi:MAG: ribosome silencing factor [bacterium]|nr:ribosome silencing factor [candidate division WOR-3 bacterium]MDH5683712.1 ribosome silencing factor [candidate division WOR-3 bacterium]